jgi:cytochrome d ubiquinol oxidase subunit I
LSVLAVTTALLSRWQFGLTAVYHFFFVPVTIGMGLFVAGFQTAWYVTGQERYHRLTTFFGKIFLVNLAVGVVTGIVMEFQFGMNWATYSRYVGDVFGVPLAIEGLVAFFLESILVGAWIFGAGRMGRRLHLALIWLVALGSIFSAYVIIAANAWMQHPVGYRINPDTGRAEMTSLWKVMTQTNLLIAFAHTISAAVITAGALVLAVSAYHLIKHNETALFSHAAAISLVVVLVGAVSVVAWGDSQARLLASEQPMKASASEAVFDNEKGAGLSLFAIQPWAKYPSKNNFNIAIPSGLSILTHGNPHSTIAGINDLNRQYQAEHGSGNYKPIVLVAYWSFRLMVGIGFFFIGWAALGLWLFYKRRLERSRRFLVLSIPIVFLPFLANSFGWVLREMGREPWIVQGLLKTTDAFSKSVSVTSVAFTLAGFAFVYTLLAGIETWLVAHVARGGPSAPAPPGEEPQIVELEY